MIIREYSDKDEKGWVKCRLLAFLDCSYYDDILKTKEKYKNPSLCVVAEDGGEIVGILDVEYERISGDVCYLKGDLGGTIWHMAVMPEYRRASVAEKMWQYAKDKLFSNGIKRIEVWTQDDEVANSWYQKQGFIKKEAYLNAYVKGIPENDVIKKFINLDEAGEIWGVRCLNFEAPIERKEELQKVCYRLHEVRLYELIL